jgi:hypothetical protein
MNATATRTSSDVTIDLRDESVQLAADITLLSTAALAIEDVRRSVARRSAAVQSAGSYSLLTQRIEAKRRSIAADQVSWDAMYRLYANACVRFTELALVPDDMAMRQVALRNKIAQLEAR